MPNTPPTIPFRELARRLAMQALGPDHVNKPGHDSSACPACPPPATTDGAS